MRAGVCTPMRTRGASRGEAAMALWSARASELAGLLGMQVVHSHPLAGCCRLGRSSGEPGWALHLQTGGGTRVRVDVLQEGGGVQVASITLKQAPLRARAVLSSRAEALVLLAVQPAEARPAVCRVLATLRDALLEPSGARCAPFARQLRPAVNV